MSEGPVRHCPGCGQALRFPAGIGGMLMACPECGYRFASPFKLADPLAATTKASTVRAPTAIASNGSFPEAAGSPREEAQQSPPPMRRIKENSLAARVAALYAANNR
ncbi:hypothetical protein [Solidesulfovibrio sp. C21]|uniref:hypothetical protein n=1 Tax=Solidesulfovibrio sp. C21 TaxID=3398613 RepID=UPI0039FBA62D